jgi:cytochrome c5
MKTRKMGKGMLLSTVACAGIAFAAMPLYAADGEAVYTKSCKMCHSTGMGGAPKAGDADAWAARIAKGRDVLYENAINGFNDKGMMPARGGNSSLTDEEVKAAVDYMIQLGE